ncbi:MAG: hypothetical protein FWE90_00145 [Defluviitaleaceae bacterium]|nr:hypothetical protein [Defluviitaleaceae bacterium]
MPEFIDYSSRRGAIVPLLPKIHALLKENAGKERLCGLEPPENIVSWRQRFNPLLLDVSRRFIFAMEIQGSDKRDVLGFVFYRYPADKKGTVYIEDMQIAHAHRNTAAILTGLIAKLETDPNAKSAVFFGSERLKKPMDKELLAGVGFKETFPDGWEPLGNMKEALGALRVRYGRAKA